MNQTRKDQILCSAADSFARYGFEKTTMGDIARAAGVARQTVYNLFDNKEAVFEAMIENRLARLRTELNDAWDKTSSFAEFLDVFLEMVPVAWFDEMATFQDPRETVSHLHRIADAQLQSFATDVIATFTARLSEYDVFDAPPKLARESFASGIYWNTVNAKYGAPNRKTFIDRIETTRMLTLLFLQEA